MKLSQAAQPCTVPYIQHIGVDATALLQRRTGVGNYIYPLLLALCKQHPAVQFSLFSNTEIVFPALPNVAFHVSCPKRRGVWWQATHLRQMLQRVQPQIYWGTNGLLPFPRVKGLIQVLTVHDLVYQFAPHTLPWYSRLGRRFFQPRSVRSADRVIAVSHATAADIAACNGRSADAVVYPVAATHFRRPTLSKIQQALARHGLRPGYLLTLGTVEPRKNLSALLQAHAVVHAEDPTLPQLVLIGRSGWKNHAILQTIRQAEATGRVRWLSNVDDSELPALYASCTVFLMPSKYEGFGMPLLEAQRCGAPVIHGTHPAMLEASDDLGFVTETSATALAHTLRQMQAGALPLCCRLPQLPQQDALASALTLWRQFECAWQHQNP